MVIFVSNSDWLHKVIVNGCSGRKCSLFSQHFAAVKEAVTVRRWRVKQTATIIDAGTCERSPKTGRREPKSRAEAWAQIGEGGMKRLFSPYRMHFPWQQQYCFHSKSGARREKLPRWNGAVSADHSNRFRRIGRHMPWRKSQLVPGQSVSRQLVVADLAGHVTLSRSLLELTWVAVLWHLQRVVAVRRKLAAVRVLIHIVRRAVQTL